MHTDGLLTSIGRATGRPDQSTFTRRFKACYGLSDTTYRKCFASEPRASSVLPQPPPWRISGNTAMASS